MIMRRENLSAMAILAALLPTSANASWLSEITGINIDIPNSTVSVSRPKPEAIPEMLQNLPKDVGQALLNPAGNALAFAIRASRATAGTDARPIPPNIRAQLSAFFPPAVLDRARFNTNKASISLPAAINLVNEGNTVTLDDLIVFTDNQQANNPVMWAHELTHVMQYSNMGVEGFANVYTLTAGSGLEQQARDMEKRVRQAINSGAPRSNWGMTVSASTGAFTQPLTIGDMQQQAQLFYPPAACGIWQGVPGGAMISNSCPVPILVTSIGVAGPYGPTPLPCTYNCIVPPRTTMPFMGVPAPVIGFTFIY